ncbi:MAG: choice-of-anchor D domain-containing protein [Ilumatobacter sp.]|uniref:choice-of-anchor D domain-containing protein n=1 Tax=Ilumatobacter sp. TaxID=1967498 RepID=UPI003C758FF1
MKTRSTVVESRRNGRNKRRTLAGSSALLAGLVMSTGTAGVGALPGVTLSQADPVPVTDAHSSVGDAAGGSPSVSGDGRYVVFHGAPGTDGDTRAATVYLTDRDTAVTTELSPVPAALRAGETMYPVIAGDGCSVVAVTEMALDVFRDDDTGMRWDVYRSTLPHCGGTIGNWELVSSRPGSGGIARDDVALAAPTTSRSGTLIAYTHPADHLFEAEGITTVSLVDIAVPIDDPVRSRFVAGSPADSPSDTFVHNGLDQPSLSADGLSIAYRSDATSSDAVPGWSAGLVDGGPATPQVFAWDIDQPDPFLAVDLISRRPDGSPSSGAGDPDVSRKGMDVAFTSSDALLADAAYPDCTGVCPTQVFLADRDTDNDGQVGPADATVISLISARNDTAPAVAGLGPSTQPSISSDGQLVAFVTKAANLQLIEVPALGSGDDGDLLLAEVRNGRLSRLTTANDGVLPTQGVHAHPDISDLGRTVVFDTAAAADLVGPGAVAGRQVVARSADPLLSLPDADMGTTLVGLRSDEWRINVINDGPSSFQPTSVTVSSPQFEINDEATTCLLSASVPAGGSCQVTLSYTPSGPGASSAIVTVAEEGFGAVSVSSEVRGEGGNPALRIDPASADLGTVVVGEPSVEFVFDLNNIGFGPTEITSFAITGAHASEFEFTSNNCAFRPLNPRASCSVGVTFTPSAAGRRTALVELTTRDDQYTTMILAGDGEFVPVLDIDTGSVDAGRDFIATGSQYPPNTEVTIVFGDGSNSSVTATTDDNGDFAVIVPVKSDERGGARTVVVQSASGAAASAPVEVIEDEQVQVGLPGFGLG